jgi:cytochrome c oxidase subunit 2
MQPGGLPLFPVSASSFSGDVDALFAYLMIVAVFFGLLISVGIIYLALRYRRRAPDEIGASIQGSMTLEIAWMVIPFLLCLVMFGWGSAVYVEMRTIPVQALEISVVGKQWMWKMQHSEGRKEINELHVPVDRAIKLTMASEDVIHDFYVPSFRVKMDIVPGRYSTLWFKATKPGKYHLYCSQYCGTNHAIMGGWVYVMEPAAYQQWLAGGPQQGSLADAGSDLFQTLACQNCHRADSTGRAPSLKGVYGSTVHLNNGQTVLADDTYIRESILQPSAKIVAGYQPVMPSFQGLVTEEQLLQLIAYIKSEGAQSAAPAAGATPPAKAQPQSKVKTQ